MENRQNQPQNQQNGGRIYAYTTPENEQKGYIKIGWTKKNDVNDRIKNQLQGAGHISNIYTLLFDKPAVDKHGCIFLDKHIHRVLEREGFEQIKFEKNEGEGRNSEWFCCSIEDVEKAYLEVVNWIPFEKNKKLRRDFPMRPEQAEAVEVTARYFEEREKQQKKENEELTKRGEEIKHRGHHFLWNAKMRFGKTFATYQLAEKMKWRKIMVLTFKPAVRQAWKDDLQGHVDFADWIFVDNDNPYKDEYKDKKVVWFASFQDIRGTKENKIKEKFKKVTDIVWDCMVLDEYHYGAWNDSSQEMYNKNVRKSFRDNLKENNVPEELGEKKGGKNEKEEYFKFNEKTFLISKVNHFLYLTGTPFRALADGTFLENQIFNWTYIDEQEAKTNWKGGAGEEKNPYEELPQIKIYTYQLPKNLLENVENNGLIGFNNFNLNEFFKAEKKVFVENGVKQGEYKFVLENEVKKWLDMIRGSLSFKTGKENISQTQEHFIDGLKIPFYSVELKEKLNHTFWFLSSVNACIAMGDLLKNDPFWKDYEVVVVAGNEGGIDPLKTVQEKIKKHKKTITISCGKLATGVSVPEWTGIFFLNNLSSPETYFQTAFRAQTPYFKTDENDRTKKHIIKKRVLYF